MIRLRRQPAPANEALFCSAQPTALAPQIDDVRNNLIQALLYQSTEAFRRIHAVRALMWLKLRTAACIGMNS